MQKIYYILLTFSLFSLSELKSQIQPPVYEPEQKTISLIGKSFGDSIVLRWAPHYNEAWLMGNLHGYNVYKYRIKENDTVLIDKPKQLKVKESPIKPLPLSEIERLYKNDKYAAIVAQAIYGSTFDLSKGQKQGSLINQALEINNRYSFALFSCDVSIKAAKAHGLVYVDKDLKPGDSYVYMVKPAWNDTLALVDSAFMYINVNDTSTLPQPIELAASFSDRTVNLSWNFKDMQSVFSSYYVERSSDNGQSFQRVTQNPLVNIRQSKEKSLKRMYYADTLPNNEQYYQYRIRGITPFGEVSPPSKVVKGIGVPQEFGLNPINTSAPMQDQNFIEINWEFDSSKEHQIKGFVIERSSKANGVFEQISDTITAHSRQFIDKKPLGVSYYQICAVSKVRGAYCSFPALIQMPDSTPPAIPTGLSAEIDSLGIVNLQWQANTEPDLLSYSIYRANNPNGDFVKINQQKVKNASYTDTVSLGTLTKNVFYCISATDYHYNHSKRSPAIKVVRPDTIAPAGPAFKNYEVSGSAINLNWFNSPSSDVSKHVLYRSQHNTNQWVVLATFSDKNIRSYADADIRAGEVYEYLLLAVDESGLESEDNQTMAIKALLKIADNPVQLKVSAEPEKKRIKISWKSKEENIAELKIYKAINDGKLELLSTVAWNNKFYYDTSVKNQHIYHYRVQAILKNQVKTKLGNISTIHY